MKLQNQNLTSESNRENSSDINSPKEKDEEEEEDNSEFITEFHLLSDQDEVEQFVNNAEDFKNYLIEVETDVHPPKVLSSERIAEILYQDEFLEKKEENSENDSEEESMEDENAEENIKLGLNVRFEYQDCCPVTIVEDHLTKIGHLAYSVKYGGKYYKFLSMVKLLKFIINPNKYINLDLPVRKVNEESNEFAEKQISFNNTINYLEFTFGSLITKGMLELSNNRIKYPYLNVRETSLKYLALFLKANNPHNNSYAKKNMLKF
jgi:YHS domain-containing protein